MKLISLYIENFGTLSQYALSFSDGVTVIQEPNGFGKTTLAEFIRAMFYGFPRKAKTLEKSRRQKYLPWNGGKCGGNLVFELDGQRYRLERTFGAVPKGDTFSLIDLSTGKKSDRFSEEIGLELFQLDGDAFERSTYMPQYHDLTSLTTDSIQAKLADLVEDADDIGNFDKAMTTLKAKRIAFIPYRGNGGTVSEAVSDITRLQKELDCAVQAGETLEQIRQEEVQLEQALKARKEDIDRVRSEIGKASAAEAAKTRREQYDSLCQRQKSVNSRLEELNNRYPKGLPGRSETEQLLGIADRAAVLESQSVITPEDAQAAALLEENRHRFSEHLPDRKELDTCREDCERHLALTAQMQAATLSRTEQQEYEALLPLYTQGALDEKTLEALAEKNREWIKGAHALESLRISPEEETKLAQLERFFAAGVPTEGVIRTHLQGLNRADSLRQENYRMAGTAPQAESGKKSSKWMLPTLILGILALLSGGALMFLRLFAAGGVLLGIGVLALIGAMYLSLRNMVTGGAGNRMDPALQSRMTENSQEAAKLEAEASVFAARYLPDMAAEAALYEILDKREDILALEQRRSRMAENHLRQAEENRQLLQKIREVLEPWAVPTEDIERTLLDLQLKRSRFLSLQAEKEDTDRTRQALAEQAEVLERKLTAYFGNYFPAVAPDRFHSLLTMLQRDVDAYTQAREAVARLQERVSRQKEEMSRCTQALQTFFGRYGLLRQEDVRAQLRQLQDDEISQTALTEEQSELALRISGMIAEDETLLSPQEEAEIPQLSWLQQEEEKLTQEHNEMTRNLLALRQRSKELRLQSDRIPELQDLLEKRNDQKNADQENARILDDVMDYLQKAKDNLSSSYLGPIRESFCGYLQRLMAEQGENVLITPDLQVRLDRNGQSRELAYFSAGQNDLVMLCMRFALVDALFREQKPFVILDDPFVNLDDERTAQALELLRELGQQRQILYLVCNSSRTL